MSIYAIIIHTRARKGDNFTLSVGIWRLINRATSMDSTAHRRLKAIQGHLLPSTEDPSDQIQTNQTAGEFSIGTPLSLSLSSPSIYTHTGCPGTRMSVGIRIIFKRRKS